MNITVKYRQRMAGESILIVDDTPVNLKLTRMLLMSEGYKALTAGSAEEALDLLKTCRPKLILADIQLPGMDGLELTRRLKADEQTHDIAVVALTASAAPGDEQRALAAGCDGFISKPIDTRALGTRVREFVAGRSPAPGNTPTQAAEQRGAISLAEMQALRRRFLSEGQERLRRMLIDLDSRFDAGEASRTVHQWVGTGGLLGYSAIARAAREVEGALAERPLDNAVLRESLASLALAFSSPREARGSPIPEPIVQALSGKRVVGIGLPANEAERLSVALERVGASAVFLGPAAPPEEGLFGECDLAVVHVGPVAPGSEWCDPAGWVHHGRPVVFTGYREDLLVLEPGSQAARCESLMDSWQPDEALVRLSRALSRPQGQPEDLVRETYPTSHEASAVVADDDPSVVALVQSTLRDCGIECHGAADGRRALETIRTARPQAAVLDADMPGLDGYEVLSAIRADSLPVRVLLLTAGHQESDAIRGFALGADDYMEKPFSPMELAARLRRLLPR